MTDDEVMTHAPKSLVWTINGAKKSKAFAVMLTDSIVTAVLNVPRESQRAVWQFTIVSSTDHRLRKEGVDAAGG